jgi:F-type H+-transporting ATPase subunit alpha
MKKVAGRLRMDLAQYRELEAFAKFGSDLDKATLAQLRRGSRLVELLKQGQYQPMPMERQVISLYAGTNGYLDEIPMEQVRRYESEMLEMMDRKYPELLLEVAQSKDLAPKTVESLKQALQSFTESFKAGLGA